MKKRFIPILILVLFTSQSFSQEGNWDVYLATYEDGPGSVALNMDLINVAPMKHLPYLLITGVKYDNCREDGFPTSEEFNALYNISDEVIKLVSELTTAEIVGSFTYQCQRLDYIYLADTTAVRKNLTNLYSSNYSSYEPYTNIKPDDQWEAYTKFLYPSEEILEYMSNEKVLMQLRQAGDDLTKPRQIDHWIYFADEKGRGEFISYVEKLGFKIENQEKQDDLQYPYSLHISKVDSVHPNEINKLTLDLRNKAKELNGQYDGWETMVITD